MKIKRSLDPLGNAMSRSNGRPGVTFLRRDEDDEYKGHSAGLPFNNSLAAIILVLVGAFSRLNRGSTEPEILYRKLSP